MNKKQNSALLLVCAIFFLSLAICLKTIFRSENIPAETACTTAYTPDSVLPYLNAVETLHQSESFAMHISTLKRIHLGNQVLNETSEKELSYYHYGRKDMQVDLSETTDYGVHSFHVHEQFEGGTALLQLDRGAFTAQISQEDYLADLIPVSVLDPSVYRVIQSHQEGAMTKIAFFQPASAEKWSVKLDSEIRNAAGYVLLDSRGNLIKSFYSVSYRINGDLTELVVNVSYHPVEKNTFTPMDTGLLSFMPIENIQVPRLLESSTGYLLQAEALSAVSEDLISCQAGNLIRRQHIDLVLQNTAQNLDAALVTEVELTDHNQGGTHTQYRQTEHFKNESYTLTVDGENAVPQQEITREIMEKYCRDQLVGTIILPEYITSVTLTDQEDSYLFTFSASEDLAQTLCANACQILYQDPDALNSNASSYHTGRIEGTLVLSKSTGLPIASGLAFSGTHTIDGTPYILTSETNQTYTFSA